MAIVNTGDWDAFDGNEPAEWIDHISNMTFDFFTPGALYYEHDGWYIAISGDFNPAIGDSPDDFTPGTFVDGVAIGNFSTGARFSISDITSSLGDVLSSSSFWDLIAANEHVDVFGSRLSDTMVGTDHADAFYGDRGDDVFYVGSEDSIIEFSGEGADTAYASGSFALRSFSEVEVLRANAGAVGITLTGSGFANTFYSGRGFDTLVGAAGDDAYYVNNIADRVTEAAGGGTDTVYAKVNYVLQADQEVEFLRAFAGSTALSLTGNNLANKIYSGAGLDTLAGRGGIDTYYVNNAGDKVVETVGGGTDTVFTSTNFALAAGQEIEFLRANSTSANGLLLKGNNLGTGRHRRRPTIWRRRQRHLPL